MGTTHSSHHSEPPRPMEMSVPFPDINNIVFNGIPKMMLVADDLHTMTQAIVDLKNYTLVAGGITIVGIILFMILKLLNSRRGRVRRRRRLPHHTDSEQSSLNRTYRSYSQKPLDWHPTQASTRRKQHEVDMEKLLEHSSSSHGSQSQQHTPPAIASKRCGVDFHPERTPPPLAQSLPTANGGTVGLKRLDPVKLVINDIEDVAYVDREN
ncbi:hypothetical protein M3Y99_00058300 [Aphelenchoides fujianensis]|nr:hypothetical protein M3Y99_00058300 [Aphelenchoides fujianensis]